MTWTETELAYAAGCVDGEGNIEIRMRYNKKGTRHHTCQVSISNTDLRMLLWLHARFDGVVSPQKRKPHSEKHKPVHIWYLSTRSCGDFLAAIRPYLVIKGEQADLVLALRALILPLGFNQRLPEGLYEQREHLRLQLRALTKRGC